MRFNPEKMFRYSQVHYWLKKEYGRASRCEGTDCRKNSSNFQWALLRGKRYARKRENFLQLCVSCHARYDCTKEKRKKLAISGKKRADSGGLNKMWTGNVGRKHPHSKETRAKIDAKLRRKPVVKLKNGKVIAIFRSVTEAAASVDRQPKVLSRVLSGERSKTQGYEWRYLSRKEELAPSSKTY